MKQLILALFLGITIFPSAYAVSCSESSYYCLDPTGRQFGGTTGPVRMWYNNVEKKCMPGPYSKVDSCELIRILCNQKYPKVCNGDCLAGPSTSWGEANCENSFIVSPPGTQPNHLMWTNP